MKRSPRPSLQLVCGLPGAGKSHYCLRRLHERPRKRLVVCAHKDQAAALRDRVDPNVIDAELAQTAILPWEEFARELALQGPKPVPPVAARPLRVGAAARCAQRELKPTSFFGAVSELPGFHRGLVDCFEELSWAGVSPEELRQTAHDAAARVADDRFAARGAELADLMADYQRALEQLRVQTNAGVAWLAVEAVKTIAHLECDEVWLDGASIPGEPMLALLAALSNRGIDAGLTLTWSPERASLFVGADRLRARLFDRFEVTETQLEAANHRAASGSLQQLSRCLFADAAQTHPGAEPPVTTLSAPNRYAEIEQVARELARLRDRGEHKCDDMAVVVRQWDGYAPAISAVFPRFDLPFCWEREEPLLHNALARTLLRTLELLADWRSSVVIELAAGSYSPLSLWEAQRLRTASRKARLKDNAAEWTEFAASRMADDANDPIGRYLNDLLGWREKMLSRPLSSAEFEKLIAEMAHELGYLDFHESGERLLRKADEAAGGAAREALRTASILERLEEQPPRPFAEHLQRARAIWHETTFRSPCDDNGVRILDATQPPSVAPKVAFVVGLLEGIFPRRVTEDPFLRDDERRVLAEATGAPLATGDERAAEERLRFYLAVTLPTEKLYLTYPRAGDESDAIPAFYLNEVREALGGSVEQREYLLSEVAPKAEEAVTERDRLLAAAAVFGARPLRFDDEEVDPRFAEWRLLPAAPAVSSPAAAKLAGWDNRTLSVTELDALNRCPFQHLASYRLRLFPLQFGVRRSDQGQLVHGALRGFFAKRKATDPLDEETLSAGLREEVERILSENPPEGPLWQIQFLRLFANELLGDFARREAVYQERFEVRPTYFELAFGAVNEIDDPELPNDRPTDERSSPKPLSLPMPGGKVLNLCGTLDRVDVSTDGSLAMVVDYKLQGSEKWGEPGEKGSLQLPLYTLAMQQVFDVEQVTPAYDSLSRNRRFRLINLQLPLGYRQSIAPLQGEDNNTITTMGQSKFTEWLNKARDRAVLLVRLHQQARINPQPEETKCQRCAYGDLCRTDLAGRHDGEPADLTPFDG